MSFVLSYQDFLNGDPDYSQTTDSLSVASGDLDPDEQPDSLAYEPFNEADVGEVKCPHPSILRLDQQQQLTAVRYSKAGPHGKALYYCPLCPTKKWLGKRAEKVQLHIKMIHLKHFVLWKCEWLYRLKFCTRITISIK